MEQCVPPIITSIQENIDSSKKLIALYHVRLTCRSQEGEIVKRLREEGHNVIIIMPPRVRDKEHGYEDDDLVFFLDDEMLAYLDFVDLVIAYESLPYSIAAKKRIYFCHGVVYHPYSMQVDSFLHYPLSRVGLGLSFLYDYFVLTTLPESLTQKEYAAQNNLKDMIPRGVFLHDNPEFTIIPGGYPKLDYFIDHLEERKDVEKNAILLSPSASTKPGYFVASHGKELVERLLKEFPQYTVIFRPHPLSVDNTETLELAGAFDEDPRFEFDTNPTYLDNYAKGVVLITEVSGTATTFSFGSLKPSISFKPDESCTNTSVPEFDEQLVRYNTGSIDQLVNTLHHIFENEGRVSNRLKELRDRSLCNVGCAEQYLVESVNDILNDTKRNDWIRFPLYSDDCKANTFEDYVCAVNYILDNDIIYIVGPSLRTAKSNFSNVFPRETISKLLDYYIRKKAGYVPYKTEALKTALSYLCETSEDDEVISKFFDLTQFLHRYNSHDTNVMIEAFYTHKDSLPTNQNFSEQLAALYSEFEKIDGHDDRLNELKRNI